MFDTILDFLLSAFNAVMGWFTDIMDSVPGALDVFIWLCLVAGAVRLIVIPLVGRRLTLGSDSATKRLENENRRDMR